jgi:hypothetical protein
MSDSNFSYNSVAEHLFIQRPKEGANRIAPEVSSIKQTKGRERGVAPMIITWDDRSMAGYNNFMGDLLTRQSYFLGSEDFLVDTRMSAQKSQWTS